MGTSMEPYDPGASSEIDSARSAADDALEHLRAARKELEKAHQWGYIDMASFGILASIVKQAKMQNANREIRAAKEAMLRFAQTLRHADLDANAGLRIELDDFWSAADIMFDSYFADLIMQRRIEEARKQADWAIEQVETIREQIW